MNLQVGREDESGAISPKLSNSKPPQPPKKPDTKDNKVESVGREDESGAISPKLSNSKPPQPPKKPDTKDNKVESVGREDESGAISPKLSNSKPPQPPKKPDTKDNKVESVGREDESGAISPKLSNSKPPQPPKKPDTKDNNKVESADSVNSIRDEIPASPKIFSKPLPPRKIKASTGSSQLSENDSENKSRPIPPSKPKQAPKPKPRASIALTESSEDQPELSTPTKGAISGHIRPVPVPRKRVSSDTKVEQAKVLKEDLNTEVNIASTQDESEPKTAQEKSEDESEPKTAQDESKPKTAQDESKPMTAQDESKPMTAQDESKPKTAQDVSEVKTIISGEDESDEVFRSRQPHSEQEEPAANVAELEKEEASLELLEEDEKSRSTSVDRLEDGDQGVYEDMSVTLTEERDSSNERGSSNELYECMDYDQAGDDDSNDKLLIIQKHSTGIDEKSKKDSLGPVISLEQDSKDYELITTAASDESPSKNVKNDDYEDMEDWTDLNTSSRLSGGFIPITLPNYDFQDRAIYDVPRPVHTGGNGPPSMIAAPSSPREVLSPVNLPQSPDVGIRANSISSSGSMSSVHSVNLSLQARKGSKDKNSLSSSRSNSLSAASGDIVNSCKLGDSVEVC